MNSCGVAHAMWDERPLLLVKLKAGMTATKEEFLQFLEGKIAKWWMPDDVLFVDDIPLGATGKIDKKLIRQRMADYVLPTAKAAPTVALAAPPEPKIYAPEPEPPPADHTAWSPQARPVQAEKAHGLTVIEPTLTEAKHKGASESEAAAEAARPFPAEPRPEAPARHPTVIDGAEAPLALPIEPRRKAKRGRDHGGPIGVLLEGAILTALAPAVMVAAGMAGTRLGLIDWKTGLGLMTLEWAPKVALLSLATALLGVVLALFGGLRRHGLKALVALALSLATLGAYVWAGQAQIKNPPVSDVATDWVQPLDFSPAMLRQRGPGATPIDLDPVIPLGAQSYAGRRVADVNAETCAAARPLILAASTADAYSRARAAAQAAGVALVTDSPRDGRIEGTMRTLAFGLPVDVVMRVSPHPQGARIDVRAVGREAAPDLGSACGRVSRLLTAIGG